MVDCKSDARWQHLAFLFGIINGMKKTLLMSAALFAGFMAFGGTSTPAGFTDDLDAALVRARENGKFVYVCFSGSDWCGWCIKLEKEVFSDSAFAAAVKDDYELVFVDSPRDKSRLSEKAKAKNPSITKAYKVRGFPTFVILKSDGSEVTRGSAYRPGGAAAYAEMLKDIKQDPDKVVRVKKLKAEWIDTLEAEYNRLMSELNVECGKYMDELAAKPENIAAGKTRDDFRNDCIVIVKRDLHKFRALANTAVEKAKVAPSEIAPIVDEYAAGLDKWIKMIDPEQ